MNRYQCLLGNSKRVCPTIAIQHIRCDALQTNAELTYAHASSQLLQIRDIEGIHKKTR